MKKIGLWVSLVLAIPILLVGGLVVFVLTLDPNDYRDEISKLAAEQGIELDIRGDLEWRLFPQLVLGVNDARLSNQSGAGQVEAQIQHFGLELRLWPLLKKRVEFRGLNITGADVVLRQQSGAAVIQEGTSESSAENAGAALPEIFFEQLQVNDSRFAFFSAESEPLVITGLSAQGESINTAGNFFPLHASFEIQPVGGLEFSDPLSLDADISVSSTEVLLKLNNLGLLVHRSNADIPISAEGGVSFDLITQQIQSESLLVTLGALELGLEVQAQLEPLLVQASVQSNEFSPASLMQLTKISFDTLDPSVLSSAQFQFDLRASQHLIELTQLQLELDDTELRGQLRADLVETPRLIITANIDQIDLDRYLPAETESQQDPASKARTPMPTHMGSYELSIGELRVKNLAITEVQSQISSSEHQIVLEELRGKLAGGNFVASSKIGLSLEDQSHRLALDANGIFIGRVLTAISGEPAPITGHFSGKFSATSAGELPLFLENMVGNGSLLAANLVLAGVDVEGRICDVSDRLQRQSLVSTYGAFAENTALQDMTASIEISGGLAKLTRLDAGIGNIRASAAGQLNLESKDYSAAMQAVIASEKTSETGCTVNRYLRNRALPFTCSGSLDAGPPQCGIDQSFVRGAIQQALTQGLTNQLLGPGSSEDGAESETETKPVQQQIIENIFNRLNR